MIQSALLRLAGYKQPGHFLQKSYKIMAYQVNWLLTNCPSMKKHYHTGNMLLEMSSTFVLSCHIFIDMLFILPGIKEHRLRQALSRNKYFLFPFHAKTGSSG